MPVFTTLEFFRSKQTLSSFDKMYPKSIVGLRETISDSLETIDNMITEITHQYLNGHKSHESYILDKAISVHLLLTETGLEGIYKKADFEVIYDSEKASYGLTEHITKLKEICKVVLDFNPNAFIPIVELFEKILQCMEKYFLSFYTGNVNLCPSKYIEVPFNYEKMRIQAIQDIKRKLQKIFTLSNQFNTIGLNLTDFGDKSNHIARRTKSLEMPFFLLFLENCDLIEESQQLLRQWVEMDKEYTRSIKIDINLMNDEKTELELRRRNEYEEYIKHRHATDQIQRDYDELLSLKLTMQTKLQKCENEAHETLVKKKYNESILYKTEIMLKETEKKILELGSSDYLEKEATTQKYLIQKTQKKLKSQNLLLQRIEVKIQWYNTFMKTLFDKKLQLDKSIELCSKHKIQLEDLDKQIIILNEYLTHLHSICALKSSNFTLKKIFHNLSFKDKLSSFPESEHRRHTSVKDELSNAIRITSQMIKKDWISLYMNLPFYPSRGKAEMENDIQKFISHQVRGLPEDLAFHSLNSWRRFHTRANLRSLVETLQNIQRSDILKKLGCVPQLKSVSTVRRIEEEKLPPLSATTKFLIKHYPNLQKSRFQTV